MASSSRVHGVETKTYFSRSTLLNASWPQLDSQTVRQSKIYASDLLLFFLGPLQKFFEPYIFDCLTVYCLVCLGFLKEYLKSHFNPNKVLKDVDQQVILVLKEF